MLTSFTAPFACIREVFRSCFGSNLKTCFRLAIVVFFGLFWVLCGSVSIGQTPITFEKVVELLELEIKEEKLLELLKNQPTVFTLSETQLAKLKSLNASEKIVQAMTRKSTAIVESDTMAYALILDVSGSMTELASNGRTKWDVAKSSAIELIKNIPSGLQIAFIVYGHDKERPCEVEVVRPLAIVTESDKAQIIDRINSLVPAGKTPIAKSLKVAANLLGSSRGIAKTLLITDGLETCEGDPVAEAKAFALSAATGRSVDVIGFALASEDSATVGKIASSGNGKYMDAKTSSDLASAFDQVKKEMHQKLTTTDGAVSSTPSKDPNAPSELKVGTYTKGRLAPKNYHYWKVNFPAGKFVVVCDVQMANEARGNVLARVSLGSYDGTKFKEEKYASVNGDDIRVRGVTSFECNEPTTKLIQVENSPGMTNIEDYHLGVFSQDSKFGVPFLVNCPEVTSLTVGQSATSPMLGNAKAFYLDSDAFYRVKIPAGGDFAIEVQWASTAPDEFGLLRSVDTYDLNGVRDRLLEHGKKNGSVRVKLITADEQEFLLGVSAAAKDEKITVKITPWVE